MTDLQKIKISINILTSLDKAKNQEEVGKLLGYTNKSSFSQILNGKTDIPKGFIEKLRSLDKTVNLFWENEFEKSAPNEDIERLKTEVDHLKEMIAAKDEIISLLKSQYGIPQKKTS